MNDIDCLIVGAGVVGLAVARAVASSDRDVIIVERERHFGMHTSSRNSEVIHAGIHYEPGSLKALLCRRGRDLLYEYCAARDIPHRRCGKLTLAAGETEMPELARIEARARANEVEDLEWLDADAVHRLEPDIVCHAALWSPSSGIVDSHHLMQALLGDAERRGANIVYGTRVSALRPTARGIEVYIEGLRGPSVRARHVVNSAGLFAADVARRIEGMPPDSIPEVRFARGSYFALPGQSIFRHLVYPTPPAGGHLGIHLTLDLAGSARFGPDTEWIEAIDYQVEAALLPKFVEAIRSYWPGLPADKLQPAYAGIRPKISKPGEAPRDFLIAGPKEHGVNGVFNLFGIESPGLTASLALGEHLMALID